MSNCNNCSQKLMGKESRLKTFPNSPETEKAAVHSKWERWVGGGGGGGMLFRSTGSHPLTLAAGGMQSNGQIQTSELGMGQTPAVTSFHADTWEVSFDNVP